MNDSIPKNASQSVILNKSLKKTLYLAQEQCIIVAIASTVFSQTPGLVVEATEAIIKKVAISLRGI